MTLATLETDLKSAVSFKGSMRFHLALNVQDIETSRTFYAKLFGKAPTKIREGYAKWDLEEPSLNFVLNQTKQASGSPSGLSHFGVQVQSGELLKAHYLRLKEVFLALLRNPPPEGVALPPWLWRLVRNHIAEYYRRQPQATAPLEQELAQAETFEVRESEAIVAAWLRGFAEFLEPKYRTPLLMADFEGASMKAIAEAHDLSLSGAKSRVQRARRMLAKNLQQCCAFHFDGEGRVSGWRVRICESQEDACCE